MIEILKLIMMIFICLQIIILNANINKLLEKSETKVNSTSNRKHTSIGQVDFSNTLNGRNNAYQKYQNKSGLYEPIKTKNGIEIKPRKDNN